MKDQVFITSTKVAEHTCPACHRVMDAVTHVSDVPVVRSPEEGDVSICGYCLTVSIFQADGSLRIATSEEAADLPDWAKARMAFGPIRGNKKRKAN